MYSAIANPPTSLASNRRVIFGLDHLHRKILENGVLNTDGSLAQTNAGWGMGLDLLAPGYPLCIPNRSGSFRSFSGSSAATPLVAGVAALLIGEEPKLTAIEVQALLRLGCSPGRNLVAGHCRHEDYGYGILNAKRSLNQLRDWKKDVGMASKEVTTMVATIEKERTNWLKNIWH